MKIVCIYHSVDLDGWMSAAIVKYWHTEKEKVKEELARTGTKGLNIEDLDFIGYNYGQPIPDLSEYDKVIMCDISFPKDAINLLGNRLIWIDHHKSAIKESETDNEQGISGLRRTDFAACELTWKYFFPNEPIPEIVRLLGRYDCFGHKGTDEERKVLKFQYGARQVISNYEQAFEFLIKSIKGGFTEDTVEYKILQQGKSIYQYLCTEAKQTYKNGFEIELGQSSVKLVDLATIPDTEPETLKNAVGTFLPYKFICINKERFNPINFGIDYHKDGYDGCACFYFDGKNYNFSLYNDNGEVDCSIIAKRYGGGGHAGASGFILTKEKFTELIK